MRRPLSCAEGVKIRQINLSIKICPCPKCGTDSRRRSLGHRWVRDIGLHCPVVLEITYSKHWCNKCEVHFCRPMNTLASSGSSFAKRVHTTAIELVTKHGKTLNGAKDLMLEKYHVMVPVSTIHDWVAEEI